MVWTISDQRAQWEQIPSAASRKYQEWHDRINDMHDHPKTAAEFCGGMNYRLLGGTTNQYEIRLNGKHRATFTVDDNAQAVKVLQVGGHT